MSRTVKRVIASVAASTLASCSPPYATMLYQGLADPPAATTIPGALGEPAELYAIETAPDPQRAIFFVQGSGCHSLTYYLRWYFRSLPGAYRVYAVQKPGVGRTDTGLAGCSQVFLDWSDYPRGLAHYRAALREVMRREGGRLTAIIGVSEGGTFAAQLAAETPGIRRLVVIGSGGLPFRKELPIVAARRGESVERLNAAFQRIAADPDGTGETEYGMTHRYWSTMLDVDPTPIFLAAEQPTLVVMGEKDESVPIESALHLRDAMAAAGRRDFALRIEPGAGHTLVRDGEDRKPAVMRDIAAWLER